MAETLREDRLYGAGKHRADEILVHHRSWWQSAGPLIGLLALLALGLLALWAYRRNQMPEVSIPKIETPNLETPSLPAIPDMPKLAEPTPPAGPTPAPLAAPAVAPEEACGKETPFHFNTNTTELREADQGSVDKLAECLKSSPDQKVRLEGRADVRGSDDLNRALAIGRAQTVKARLTSLGVPESQLSIVVQPATCSEATESCWQQDRSVAVTSY